MKKKTTGSNSFAKLLKDMGFPKICNQKTPFSESLGLVEGVIADLQKEVASSGIFMRAIRDRRMGIVVIHLAVSPGEGNQEVDYLTFSIRQDGTIEVGGHPLLSESGDEMIDPEEKPKQFYSNQKKEFFEAVAKLIASPEILSTLQMVRSMARTSKKKTARK